MEKKLKWLLLVILCAFSLIGILSCGSSDDDDDTTGEESLADRLGGEEDFGTSAQTIAIKADAVINAFVTYSEGNNTEKKLVLDSELSAEENLEAIEESITKSLEEKTCATIEVGSDSVSLSAEFGEECIIAKSGIKITGTVEVTITKTGETVTAEFKFTGLSLDGVATISGSAKVESTGTDAVKLSFDLTSDDVSFSFDGTVTQANNAITISGTGEYTKGEVSFALSFLNVVWQFGNCYPSSGSIALTKGRITETITFDENTPQTGKAELAIGRATETITLKAYGSCPSAAGE